jgi:hypothetical protein
VARCRLDPPTTNLGLMPRRAALLVEERQARKLRHALEDLPSRRIYDLALGSEDANDAARLAGDPQHRLFLGRGPVTGTARGSQTTLSRFENDVARGEERRRRQPTAAAFHPDAGIGMSRAGDSYLSYLAAPAAQDGAQRDESHGSQHHGSGFGHRVGRS